MKLNFACHSTRLLECCAASFFCFFGIVGTCTGQSGASGLSDSASRATTIYKQGMAALQNGDLDCARAAFEKVVRLAPQSPEGHNSLGWVLLARDQVDAAIRQFQSALKLRPDFVEAHINLANALIRKGDLSLALGESREAVHLAPND